MVRMKIRLFLSVQLTWFEKQHGNLAYVQINEMFSFVSHVAETRTETGNKRERNVVTKSKWINKTENAIG